ncbi:MAG: site-2 protease family protein [Planctomycetes bacterium]|nr:site-2 protease family protein [Planctomycetota bacterium]
MDQPAATPDDLSPHLLRLRISRCRFAGSPRLADKLVLALCKLLRWDPPASSDFPAVRTLAPFRVEGHGEDMRAAMAPQLTRLAALGFAGPVHHLVRDPVASCDTAFTSLAQVSGRALARVTCRRSRMRREPEVFVQFWSRLPGGRTLLTWTRGCELDPPPGWEVERHPGAVLDRLWDAHQDRLAAPPLLIALDAVEAFAEGLQQELVAHNLATGVFRPCTADECARHRALLGAGRAASGDDPVLAEVAAIQTASAGSWSGTLVLLVLSLLAFVAAGLTRDSWDLGFLITLVVVLLVHESGHWLAMRWSGYRNLRMFFIPFLGAAVSGQCFNVPGWRKVLVSLAGPLPGIVIGCALAGWALTGDHPAVAKAALLTLILNGLNLLPILPLDGGWVAHHLVFARRPWLEVVFRGLAVVALLGAAIALKDYVLGVLGVFMAIGLPLAARLARLTAELRQGGVVPPSQDGQSIPPEAALTIAGRLRAAIPALSPRQTAQHVLAVFEAIHARPPRLGGTLGLLALHAVGIVLAVVGTGMAGLAVHGGWSDVDGDAQALEHPGLLPLAMAEIGAPPTPGASTAITLVARCRDHHAALLLAEGMPGAVAVGPRLLLRLEPGTSATSAATRLTVDGRPPGRCSSDRPALVMVAATPPDDPARSAELEALLGCPWPGSLIAPWDESADLTPQQQRARACAGRLATSARQPGNSSASRQRGLALMRAHAADDRAAIARLEEEESAALRSRLDAALAREEAAEAELAAALGAVRAALPAMTRDTWPDLLAGALAPALGALPAGAGNPRGVQSGGCPPLDRRPWHLWLSLPSPADSLPRLLPWLAAQGFSGLSLAIEAEDGSDGPQL